MKWHKVKELPPVEGMPVIVLYKNNKPDKDCWTTDIAYYCDGEFYRLVLDPYLGVLRKELSQEPVEYWTEYIKPTFIGLE